MEYENQIDLPAPLPAGAAARSIAPEGFVEHVNHIGAGVRQISERLQRQELSLGEFRDNLERRVGEATAALRDAKATAAMEGLNTHLNLSEGEVWNRYGTREGLRLRAVERSVKLPSGKVEKVRAFGYLDDPHPCNAEQVEAQRAFRALALAGSIKARRGAVADEMVDTAYRNLMAVLAQTPTASRSPQVRAILDGSAGSGLEMLAIPTLADVRRPTRLARRLAGLVPVRNMPSDSWKEITKAGNALMRKRSVRGDDPARYERVKFSTSDTTISAYSYTAQTLIDDNLLSNPAAVVSITDEAMAFLDQMEADTMEVQLLHADSNGQDTAYATWTLGSYFTAGELDGSDSPVKQFIGWRARAFDDATDASAGGAFDEVDWFGTIKLMGNRAVGNLVASTGIATYFTHILPNAKFINRDYVADNATLLTGQVTQIGGVPLILSEFLPAEFPSSGLYTTSGSTGQIVVADPTAYTWDMVPGMDGDWEVNEQHRGAVYIGFKRTYRLTCRVASSDKPTALIRNL